MAGRQADSQPSWIGAASGPRKGIAWAEIDDPGRRLGPGEFQTLRAEVAAALGQVRAVRGADPGIGPGGEVRVRLVGDAEMSEAHLKYSNIPGTTDVLTFDLAEGAAARGEALDVDILVCVDEARRQAATRGHAVGREVLLYILHGVLHCLGHDDHDDGAYERMHAEEDRILRAIGVGPVFGAPAGPSEGRS